MAGPVPLNSHVAVWPLHDSNSAPRPCLWPTAITMDDDDNDDDDGAVIDEDAYDLSSVKRPKRDEAAFGAMAVVASASCSADNADTGPRAAWAEKWKAEKERPKKLKGSCAKWIVAKGFGFIKREDGLPDLYCHQREVSKQGFRSLREGEPLEFDVEAMQDGRLQVRLRPWPAHASCRTFPPCVLQPLAPTVVSLTASLAHAPARWAL
jgi:CspA family cold shock protein